MAGELDASMANLRLLHEQSVRKKRQMQDLQKEELALELQFEEQLLRHAQADCKQLANMMHEKLPQELRELIYKCLYLEDAPIPIGLYHFTTYIPEALRSERDNAPAHSEPFIVIPEGATKQDHSVHRDQNIVFPDSRLLDPAYLGYTVARDAFRYYYKSNTFSICTLENTLPDFLFKDPITNFSNPKGDIRPLGLTPIDHLRSLQIRVKYEHYNTYLTFYDNLHDGEKNLIRHIFNTLQMLTAQVHSATASRLRVEFCIMTAYAGSQKFNIELQRHHTNLLEAIRVPVYTLKHDLGADVTIMHYDEYCIPFPRNVTGIFQLDGKQWAHEKNALQSAGIQYSPLHCYVARKGIWEGSEGVSFDDLPDLLKNRWGLLSAFDYMRCHSTIRESEWWPLTGSKPWRVPFSRLIKGRK